MSKHKTSSLGLSSKAAFRLARNQKDAGVKPYTYATLVYPFAFTSSSMTGGDWYWQFRLNSLFDPDFTGGGSQPTTFDQWMTLYDRYRVLATTAEVDIVEVSNPQQAICAAGSPSVDAVPTLTYTGICGMRDAVVGTSGTFMNERRFRRTFAMKDVFGVDEEAMMSEVNYSGTSSTSAPSVAYFSVGVKCAGSTGTIFIHGLLRFAVRFETPHANNVSLTKAASAAVDSPSLSRPLVSTSTAGELHDVRCTCPRCIALTRGFTVLPK